MPETLKRCTMCKQVKAFSEFSKQANGRFGLCPRCRKCKSEKAKKDNSSKYKAKHKASTRAYYLKNRSAIIKYSKEYYLANRDRYVQLQRLRQYGLTSEQFDAIKHEQEDKCAVCRGPYPGRGDRNWHVDHDHATGKVRGLLCWRCNVVIGNALDQIDILKSAVSYLTNPPAYKILNAEAAEVSNAREPI